MGAQVEESAKKKSNCDKPCSHQCEAPRFCKRIDHCEQIIHDALNMGSLDAKSELY